MCLGALHAAEGSAMAESHNAARARERYVEATESVERAAASFIARLGPGHPVTRHACATRSEWCVKAAGTWGERGALERAVDEEHRQLD